MITWRRPTAHELGERAAALRDAPFTYDDVGATEGRLPDGYHHDRYERNLGSGDGAWDLARSGILSWATHINAQVRVEPNLPPEAGRTVMLAFDIGPACVIAPCRIVAVVNDSARVGFIYGTLPGHPERGEESFMVERHNDGTVHFVITAFSMPAELPARIAGPLARRIQKRITHRYLDALLAS